MIRFFRVLATLAILSLAQPVAACDPPAMQRQAPMSGAMMYGMQPQMYAQPMQARYQAPPGYMLVPIQSQPMYAQPMRAAPMMGYSTAGNGMAMSYGGGVGVSVSQQRAILPRNRSTTVNVAGPGMSMSVRSGGRAAAACST